MKISRFFPQLFLFLVSFCVIAVDTSAQTTIDPKAIEALKGAQKHKKALPELDEKIKAGFALLGDRKWAEARVQFEGALAAYNKAPYPSEFLFTKMSLPDEDPNEKLDESGQVLIGMRHSLGTEQTLLEFLAFTSQLEGNSAQADKYIDQIYKLQSPLWGLSWKMFIAAAYSAFSGAVKPEKNENFGKYLFLAGDLLLAAGDRDAREKAFVMFLAAQEIMPKHAPLAAHLASFYIMRKDAASAKKQALLSLSIDPKQNRVLIDLATAQWMLDEVDDAAKSAQAAMAIDPELPGPHATLALVALEKGDTAGALKEAAAGVTLSGGHPYYLAIQAAAFEASGDGKQAEKLIREAYQKDLPTKEDLSNWFLRGRPLNLILTVISRLRGTERVG